jgi:aryl-alcohol dehydrogenase-like predicted oxidoreductase
VVILSKCYFGVDESNPQLPIAAVSTNDGDMVNQQGLSRKHIFDAVQNSVERLGTYIDVLQIHRLDRDTPREEIMKALNDVIEKGWVRYIGASSVCFCVHLLTESRGRLLTVEVDGSLGIPNPTKHRGEERMA